MTRELLTVEVRRSRFSSVRENVQGARQKKGRPLLRPGMEASNAFITSTQKR